MTIDRMPTDKLPIDMLPGPGHGFEWVAGPGGHVLRCTALAEIAVHLFTTRHFALASVPQADRWAELAAAVGVETSELIRVKQVHGRDVFVADRTARLTGPDERPAADAIVTSRADRAIAVQVADCVPLLVADRRSSAIAAVHAGWRGTAAGVSVAAVETMVSAGCRPADLVVAIGPSIGGCCYQVHPNLGRVFLDNGWTGADIETWFIDMQEGRPMLDLWRANRDQLERAGVLSHNIHVAGLCTSTHRDTFYSYRAEGPGTGRMVGVIRPGKAGRA